MKTVICSLLACALAAPALAADLPPVRDFARRADFERVKLSPNGEYIAMSKRVDGHTTMAFVRLADSKPTGTGFNFGTDSNVADFWWVGPDRVVASMGVKRDYFGSDAVLGRLYGIDVNGERSASLSFNAGMWTWMVDPLPREPKWALIRLEPVNRDDPTHWLRRVNVYTGELEKAVQTPADRIDTYITDEKGQVRLASGYDAKNNLQSFVMTESGWEPLAKGDLGKYAMHPLNFSAAENTAWIGSNEKDGDLFCLVKVDIATRKRTSVACDPSQSLAWTLDSADGTHPIAAVFNAGMQEIRVLAPESPEGKVITNLTNTFAGRTLGDFSMSLDGTKLLFRVSSDRDPGSYFLLDTQAGKLRRLLTVSPWIKPEQMAERRPIEFKARGGKTIHGYLTLPNGVSPAGLPLVVNPHGGPFWIRDYWGWDAEPQMLASRGYAVLQVNFRGSGGYGNSFLEAGYKNWGTTMIDDITDGLRYTIAQGYADPARVCIYGVSYGGYAAMMSAVREPDAYKCVVAFAGIYDLPPFLRDTDTSSSWQGSNFIQDFVGVSNEIKAQQSPLTYIDKLKAPVFIVHGEDDKRVPFRQAKLLRSALEDRKIPYEWLSKSHEEHGFYNEDNRVEFYEKMLAFLDKYIGKPTASAAK